MKMLPRTLKSLQSLQLLYSNCRRKFSKMTDSVISALNKELDALLQKNDVEAEKLFRDYVRRQYFRRFFKWFLVVLAILCAIYWVPTLNWNAAAIGRLVLIKLVRPFYNWEKWADARCLIEWSHTSEMHETDENSNEPNLFSLDECSTCENLVTIDRQSNISFSRLQSNYVWRNHPVIITESHPNWLDIHDGIDFVAFIKTLPDLMTSEPCNVASNLLAKSEKLQKIIRQTERLESQEKWFFHFRNCQFKSVKASRAIIPYHRRPSYLPSHLPPFRSSWILVSHQYEIASKSGTAYDFEIGTMKQLNVRDLVMVMQLQGEIYGRLAVNTVCKDHCIDHTFRLTAGQSIVFVAHFWSFYYQPIAATDDVDHHLAITFIIEYEWD